MYRPIDDQGVLSGILVNERWLNLFGHPNATMQGLVVAIFELGAWFTAYPTSWFMDRIGRRWTIMVGALIFIVGGVLQTASNTMIQLLFGRLIAGFGIGFLSTVLPVYTAELSRAHNVSAVDNDGARYSHPLYIERQGHRVWYEHQHAGLHSF